jgi:hypothetical protein
VRLATPLYGVSFFFQNPRPVIIDAGSGDKDARPSPHQRERHKRQRYRTAAIG